MNLTWRPGAACRRSDDAGHAAEFTRFAARASLAWIRRRPAGCLRL